MAAQVNKPHKQLTTLTMHDILERDNMRAAFKRVKANKGVAGSDNLNIEETAKKLKSDWPKIKEQLLNGSYKPSCVKTVYIPKPKGGKRMLGIPSVQDRIIQQAILQKLNPIFDKEFSKRSFGFRPRKNAWQAVKTAHQNLQRNYKVIAVDVDLEKFFDNVNHDKLMAKLAKKIQDKSLLKLLRKYLQNGIMENGVVTDRTRGTPQGSPLSPLLSNIVLDDLDKELEKRGHEFCRYADDIQIYVTSHHAGDRVLRSISNFIEGKLKLKVNKDKSKVGDATKTSFLGYAFLGWKTPRIRCSKETIERFKNRIRQLTCGRHRVAIENKVEAVEEYVRGWSNYFRLATTKSKFRDLDSWVRSRLRMCLMKLWYLPRTRVRNMIKHGLPVEDARGYGAHKRWWHYAQLHHTRFIFNNQFWKDKGYNGICYYIEKFGNV